MSDARLQRGTLRNENRWASIDRRLCDRKAVLCKMDPTKRSLMTPKRRSTEAQHTNKSQNHLTTHMSP